MEFFFDLIMEINKLNDIIIVNNKLLHMTHELNKKYLILPNFRARHNIGT